MPRSRRQAFAAAMWDLADLEQAASSRRSFRARAYRAAVWALDDLSPDLAEERPAMTAVAGIGPGIASLAEEYRDTGAIRRLDQLRVSYPAESGRLRRLPRMSATVLRRLKEAGIDTVEDLAAAIEGESVEVHGVGMKTLSLWSERLDMFVAMAIFDAAGYAQRLGRHIERHTGAEAAVTGSIRRFDELVEAVELVLIGGDEVTGFLAESALVRQFAADGDEVRLQTLGAPVLAHLSAPGSAGTSLALNTGPPEHVSALRSKLDGRDWPQCGSEEDFYSALAVDLVPPPARSADLARHDDLPRVEQLRGDLHLHSDWSPDGRQSLEDLVGQATRRGLAYIAITDHALNLRFGGLSEERLLRQRDAIEQLRTATPGLMILHGAELNIGIDGSLDYSDEILGLLDFRLASIHSHFDLEQAPQTDRLLRAVTNPLVHVIAHPTGRRIGRRPPLAIDMGAVIEAAVESRAALEVNGHLDRLDLGSSHAAEAARRGALFAASSDSHRLGEMANVANSVAVLQRAHADQDQIVNSWEPKRFQQWLRSKSEGS